MTCLAACNKFSKMKQSAEHAIIYICVVNMHLLNVFMFGFKIDYGHVKRRHVWFEKNCLRLAIHSETNI